LNAPGGEPPLALPVVDLLEVAKLDDKLEATVVLAVVAICSVVAVALPAIARLTLLMVTTRIRAIRIKAVITMRQSVPLKLIE
jgi:hypothetical protein